MVLRMKVGVLVAGRSVNANILRVVWVDERQRRRFVTCHLGASFNWRGCWFPTPDMRVRVLPPLLVVSFDAILIR